MSAILTSSPPIRTLIVAQSSGLPPSLVTILGECDINLMRTTRIIPVGPRGFTSSVRPGIQTALIETRTGLVSNLLAKLSLRGFLALEKLRGRSNELIRDRVTVFHC